MNLKLSVFGHLQTKETITIVLLDIALVIKFLDC